MKASTWKPLAFVGGAVGLGLACCLVVQVTDVGWLQRIPQRLIAWAVCMWAGLCFQRGDPPRLVWIVIAQMGLVGSLVGLANDEAVFLGPLPLAAVLIVLANGCWVFGVASLWNLVRRTGLVTPWTGLWRVLFGGVLLVGIGMTIPTWVKLVEAGWPAGVEQWAWAVRRVVGVGADAAVLCFAFLLARIALPMRGGAVALPFFLLVAAALFLLSTGIGLALAGEVLQESLGTVFRLLEAIGWGFVSMAALAQGLLVASFRR